MKCKVKSITVVPDPDGLAATICVESPNGNPISFDGGLPYAAAALQVIGQQIEAAALEDNRWRSEPCLTGVVESIEISTNKEARASFKIGRTVLQLVVPSEELYHQLLEYVGERVALRLRCIANNPPIVIGAE